MAKTPNYTVEQEAEIRKTLNSTVDQTSAIEELAEAFGKSVASVRQKAVRMNLYKKKEYVGKTGQKAESKAAIVGDIAEALGVNIEQAESLEKANKSILQTLREALK
jgi:hypothetical protein